VVDGGESSRAFIDRTTPLVVDTLPPARIKEYQQEEEQGEQLNPQPEHLDQNQETLGAEELVQFTICRRPTSKDDGGGGGGGGPDGPDQFNFDSIDDVNALGIDHDFTDEELEAIERLVRPDGSENHIAVRIHFQVPVNGMVERTVLPLSGPRSKLLQFLTLLANKRDRNLDDTFVIFRISDTDIPITVRDVISFHMFVIPM